MRGTWAWVPGLCNFWYLEWRGWKWPWQHPLLATWQITRELFRHTDSPPPLPQVQFLAVLGRAQESRLKVSTSATEMHFLETWPPATGFQLGKLSPKDTQWLVQGHTAGEGLSQDSAPQGLPVLPQSLRLQLCRGPSGTSARSPCPWITNTSPSGDQIRDSPTLRGCGRTPLIATALETQKKSPGRFLKIPSPEGMFNWYGKDSGTGSFYKSLGWF